MRKLHKLFQENKVRLIIFPLTTSGVGISLQKEYEQARKTTSRKHRTKKSTKNFANIEQGIGRRKKKSNT